METLLQLRKTRGLTQKDVADALGISRQAYANYETGNREPELTTLKTLAEFFGVTVDYLLGKDEISTPEQLEIGKRIRLLRQSLNLTQEELAKKAGYTSRSSINKIELGLVDLPQSKIVLLAQALGVTPLYLLFGVTSEQQNNHLCEQFEIAQKNGAAFQEIFDAGSDEGDILALVFDNKNEVNEDYAPFQGFWIKLQELCTFLNICKENKKYVQLEFNFAEEGTDG